MKVLLDTNVWIRYIIKDDEKQFAAAKNLVKAGEEGLLQVYSSSIIFLEISYVLKNLYHFRFDEILEVLHSIRQTRDIVIMEDTDLDSALKYYEEYKVKFTDCLIASQLAEGLTLVTFDREFTKIKEISSKTPQEIYLSIQN